MLIVITLEQARTKHWQLGTWQLDAPNQQLILTNGSSEHPKTVALTNKMQDLLLLLITNPVKTISKEHIAQSVWTDGQMSEPLIARTISDLRHVFNDDPRHPVYIETVAEIGYRWLTEVIELNDPQVVIKPSRKTEDKSRLQQALIASIGIMILGIGLWWQFSFISLPSNLPSNPPEQPQQTQAPPMPLTNSPGIESTPTLSADGKLMAYSYRLTSEHPSQIIVAETANRRMLTQISATSRKGKQINHFAPRFSPDGNKLAFSRYIFKPYTPTLASCGIYYIELSKPQNEHFVAPCSTRFMMSLDWSSDSKQLYFTQDNAAQQQALVRADLHDSQVRPLALSHVPGAVDHNPRISPDGKQLIFIRQQPKPDLHSAIYWLDLTQTSNKNNPAKALTPQQPDLNIESLSWLDNQQLLYNQINQAGHSVWQLQLKDLSPRLLSKGYQRHLNYHQASRALLYTQSSPRSRIKQLKLNQPNAIANALISSNHANSQPKISPDGQTLAFVSDKTGNEQIWLANIDGSGQHQLSNFVNGRVNHLAWSPDNEQLLVTLRDETLSGLYKLNRTTKTMTKLDLQTQTVIQGRWSSHPDWLIASCNQNNQWQICRIPASGGQAIIMTDQGGMAPLATSNSDRIYFADHAQGLWTMPLLGGKPQRVWHGLTPASLHNWHWHQDFLFYLSADENNNQATIYRRNMLTNQTVMIYRLQMDTNHNNIEISPDGNSLYVSQQQPARDDIYMRYLY